MVTATNITLDNFYSITVVCELLKLKNRTLKDWNDSFFVVRIPIADFRLPIADCRFPFKPYKSHF